MPGTPHPDAEELRRLVASVRDYAIFMLDPGGHVRTWNPGAERLKGYAEHEAIGLHLSSFYTEEDRRAGVPERGLRSAEAAGSFEGEGWRVRRDGTRFWANVVITAVRDDDGGLRGFAKVTRDLTERREAELRLRTLAAELERSNAELEQFASTAAHDLVEPLHTIAGFARLLEQRAGGRLDEEGRVLLGEIAAGAARMQDVVRSLLDYARAAHGEVALGTVELGSVVAAVVAGLGARIEERGARVTWDASSLPSVRGDAGVLQSVLGNLVGNALKFGGDGVVVRVTAAPEGGSPAWWVVAVEDDGPGIAEADLPRVFELFHRGGSHGAVAGAGIGLALTRRLVERLGGRIGVEPRPGGGSRFWFTVPDARP